MPATLEALQASATAILNKIASLPIEQLVGSLSKTAAGVETMVNSPELRDGLRAVGPALKQLQQTIGRVDADAGPLLASLKTTAEKAADALRQAQATHRLGPAHDRPRLGADRQRRHPDVRS